MKITFFMMVLLLLSVVLIVLVLIQRGKGGGLAGAFGGMGGQSAFGTKAGDMFTKITIGVATFWILLCMAGIWMFGPPDLLNIEEPDGLQQGASSKDDGPAKQNVAKDDKKGEETPAPDSPE